MKRTLTLTLALLLTLTLAGCASTAPQPTPGESVPAEGTDAELTKVTVILDYLPNTNHTGLYVAEEQGFYRDAGIDVDIVQPSEGATATLIASGQGDFGVSYQEDLTYARTAKEPLPIKAIAAVLAHNTSGFMSYKSKNITSPKDFEGKTYMGWGSPAEEAIIKAVMQRAGANFDTLKILSSTGDEDFFTLGKTSVDLSWQYYAWSGIEAEEIGFENNFLPLTDLHPALDFYTPILITSEKLIQDNPALVKAFTEATAKGYGYAIENPDLAAETLYNCVPENDLEFLKKSQNWISSKYKDADKAWGVMEDARWDAYTQFMKDNALIDKDMPPAEAYTNEFLPK